MDIRRRLRRAIGQPAKRSGQAGRSGGGPSAGAKTRDDSWVLHEHDLPACPPGWSTGPPDFVGVGAQKAGTTWWFRLVEAHPDVHQDPNQRPEIHFFDRLSSGWLTAADIERYHRFFPRPPGGTAGEKTPEYMADYWVPAMLREAAPEARIIALLRDPIERYRSARTHGARRNWPQERRTEADAFHMGLYAAQLRRIFGFFPRDQVLVLQYERCVQDPAAELARTYAFLGLAPHELSEADLERPRNVTKIEKVPLDPQRREVLISLYEEDVRELPDLVPDLDLSLWPNFRHMAAAAGTGAGAAAAAGLR